MKYFCQPDGGQWNVPVEIVYEKYGLCMVRSLTSECVGVIGTDGHCYLLSRKENLFEVKQQ